jgi:hypothetical protein
VNAGDVVETTDSLRLAEGGFAPPDTRILAALSVGGAVLGLLTIALLVTSL